jgi:hypothetical protein
VQTTLIIRDDDTSFFTSPDLLNRVYGRLLSEGIPISLSVIPAHNANVRVAHRPGNPFDPSIPPGYRGRNQDYPVTRNQALCVFLQDKVQEGLLEVCLHGFNHAYMEFDMSDTERVEQKLREGRTILSEAVPEAPIETFIAPYDKLSPEAFETVLKVGYHLSTRPESVPPDTFPEPIPDYAHLAHPYGRSIFTCEEYIFTHRDEPADCLARIKERLAAQDFLIITNHYWSFFYDWKGPHPLLDAWDQLVDELLSNQQSIRFTTFQQYQVSS